MNRKRIVILGGGMTGLCTADQLARAGDFDIVLIEKESEWGGMGRGAVVRDQIFDLGPHAFWTRFQNSFQYCKDVCGEELIELGAKNVAVFFRGRQFPYPLRLTATLLKLGWRDCFYSARDYAVSSVTNMFREPQCRSFEDYIVSYYGRRLYEIFFRDYTAKTWGISPTELAAEFAAERIPKLSVFRALRKTVTHAIFRSHSAAKAAGKYTFHSMFYPKYGFRSFVQKMAQRVAETGVTMEANAEVVRVDTSGGKATAVVYKQNGVERRVECDALVSSLPVNQFALKLGQPELRMQQAAGALRFREMHMLFLVVNKPQIYEQQWIYYQDSSIYMHRVYETKVFGEGVSPNPAETGICAEVTNRDNLSPEQMMERVVSDFERMGKFRRSDVLDWKVVYLPHAYPLYDLNYKQTLDTLLGHIHSHSNVITAGRQGLFVYIDFDHCMEKGRIIAEHLAHGRPLDPLYKVFAAHGTSKT